jgi:hypothetical protein
MTFENVAQTKQDASKTASRTDDYDPFIRGRFPVGVRTVQALDEVRHRLFPCEIWYPASSQYVDQDLAPETQDFFTVPLIYKSCRQMAVRNAAVQAGTYPLVIFSHSSGGDSPHFSAHT